jgi:cholesterol transport system auxiliary component
MISRTRIATGLTVMGLGLSGCFSVLPDPKPANIIYRLSSEVWPVAKLPTAEAIRVDRPLASQVFNTNDIVVASGGQKLSVISQANWAETAPVMIQSAMLDALAASPKFIGLTPTTGARTETRLHLSVVNFEASFDQGLQSAPLGVVSYRVTYARADNRNLLGTYLVKKTARAASINVSSVVSAIETANEAAMTDIVKWLENQSSSGRS